MRERKEWGLYVHVPFCRHKCLYCDFYTGGERIADWDKYTECLLRELDEHCSKEGMLKISTLYIGGGTPSLIPSSQFMRLISGLRERLDPTDLIEFTIEVNPEDVDEEKIMAWKEAGVNRVSMGVQSLEDKELIRIGRKHDSETAVKAFEKLKKNFENISIDIMFGIPGQTLESYRQTLEQIIHLSPVHISSYSLMLENGTAMTRLHKEGRLNLPDEEEWMKMYDLTTELLETNGYYRYEISNYAKSGYESKHNMSYWEGKPYIGLGPGAHSYDGERNRYWNPNDIKGYLRQYEYSSERNSDTKISPYIRENEELTDEELQEEMVMTRLRMAVGLSLDDFGNKFGEDKKKKLLQKAQKYISGGFLKKNGNFINFTPEGFAISDSILSELI